MNESCQVHEWVTSNKGMSPIMHINESRHQFEWVMSHVRMIHVRIFRETTIVNMPVCIYICIYIYMYYIYIYTYIFIYIYLYIYIHLCKNMYIALLDHGLRVQQQKRSNTGSNLYVISKFLLLDSFSVRYSGTRNHAILPTLRVE